jgi:putative IMPACT (imprinted ancient) family translation regulator
MLGLDGWFSTNILGNRDGAVLDDPESFKTKEESKLSVLEYILQPELYPELYKDYYHKVRINYYPPRGDAKEGWDNIDIRGWLDYPMQIKVDFLCRDSILAAPIVLDLALFLDLASRAGMSGIQEWLSFYLKSPMHAEGIYPEHDLFIQHTKLKNTLRWMMGEEQITHLGLEYYLHCAAWRLAQSIWRALDAGEPSGTAGAPILAALDARGLLDVGVVVTRYFGGTKLGVGGLARAYGEASAAALDAAPTRLAVPAVRVEIRYPFPLTSGVMRSIERYASRDLEHGFSTSGAQAWVRLTVPKEDEARLADHLREQTAGALDVEPLADTTIYL